MEDIVTSMVDQQPPTRLSELTPEFLTDVLRSSGHIGRNDVITGWEAAPIGAGVGLLSDIAKLDLTYAAGKGPLAAVVAKFASANEQNRAVAQGLQMYEREVRFYENLAADVGECCPRSFYSYVEPGTGHMVLLMEDLSGYRPGDQTHGCSLAEAELAIPAAARLHAATWHAENREDLAWWPRSDGPLWVDGVGGAAAAVFDQVMEAFAPVVRQEVADAGERYKAAIPELHHRMGQGPQALIHGDFRLDNFMFGVAAGHRPFVMLDMQAPIVTKAIHDVAYLLTQSMDVDLRRAHERRLVADYHAALIGLGVDDYTAEQCWQDYRTATLHCLEYAIVIAGALQPGNERGRAFVEGCLRRSCQAIVDLDLLSLLP
jgi:hypothetical protein